MMRRRTSTSASRPASERCRAVAAAILLAALAGPATAQGTGVPSQLPVATLDQEALFLQSAFGKRLQRELEAGRDALTAENRRIEAELVAEEQALTDQRKALAPTDFAPLAQAFDQKVETIRAQQDAKARTLQQKLDRERQRFLSQVGPALAEILRSRGALVLIDSNAVLIAAGGVDITDLAIAAIDQRIGDGSLLDDAAPAGEEVPGGAPGAAPADAPPEPSGGATDATSSEASGETSSGEAGAGEPAGPDLQGSGAPGAEPAGAPTTQGPAGLSLGVPVPETGAVLPPAAPGGAGTPVPAPAEGSGEPR